MLRAGGAISKRNESKELGARLKRRAKEKGVPVAVIAAECHVSNAAVYQWFATGRVAKKHLVKLAQLMDWTVRDLLGAPAASLALTQHALSIRAKYLADLFDTMSAEEQDAVWPALLKLLGKSPGADGDGNGGESPPRRPKPSHKSRPHGH